MLIRATLPREPPEPLDLAVDVGTLVPNDVPVGSSRPPSDVRFVTGEEFTPSPGGDPCAQIEVAVRDADGRPAPFASLELDTIDPDAYADLDADGIVRLDSYTDRLGRRTFQRVPAGPLRVLARHRGRRAEAALDVLGPVRE